MCVSSVSVTHTRASSRQYTQCYLLITILRCNRRGERRGWLPSALMHYATTHHLFNNRCCVNVALFISLLLPTKFTILAQCATTPPCQQLLFSSSTYHVPTLLVIRINWKLLKSNFNSPSKSTILLSTANDITTLWCWTLTSYVFLGVPRGEVFSLW